MSISEAAPIACTLPSSDFKERVDWVQQLTSDALRSYELRGLALDLRFAPEAKTRVRELVRREQECCPFLSFEIHERENEFQLIVTAPPEAADAADALFKRFVAGGLTNEAGCGCGGTAAEAKPSRSNRGMGPKAASATAVACGAGALLACSACVLPLALPAIALAASGGALAWLYNAHVWMTALGVLAVLAAWAWIGWQSLRSRVRPSAATLVLVGIASGLVVAAVLWPQIEPRVLETLFG